MTGCGPSHHDLYADARSRAIRHCRVAARQQGIRGVRKHAYLPGVHIGNDRDEDAMAAKGQNDAARQERSCSKLGQCPDPENQAGSNARARWRRWSHPDHDSSQRLGLPHGGRQLSSIMTLDAMGMAKERDRTEVNADGAGSGIGDKHNEDTAKYPGSGLS